MTISANSEDLFTCFNSLFLNNYDLLNENNNENS